MVHRHGLEGEPFIVRDTLTCELNGAHAGDSVAGIIASQEAGVERLKRDADAMKESTGYAHMLLKPVVLDGALQGMRFRPESDDFHWFA